MPAPPTWRSTAAFAVPGDAELREANHEAGRFLPPRTNRIILRALSLLALCLLVPLSLALEWMGAAPMWVFAFRCAAIVPLGSWIRRATEQVAERAGPPSAAS